uniref:Tc1-like transposase DDE domain-containing protein n=1 Tax=Physcomitrium patens TaxID=3218 RepID=A0A2K1KIB7_PHYPA|nr:hypothetical protein PHYPA_007211 [Physcomitrium patens]
MQPAYSKHHEVQNIVPCAEELDCGDEEGWDEVSNRRHTLVELANLVSVSRTTVRFYLRELGFRNCIAPKKPYLNVKHKAERLALHQLVLMEDGAPVHRSLLPLQWRRVHGIEKLFWPANSPDLNPIENVWMVVKDLLKHHSRPNSKLEMIEKIQSVWDTISIEWLCTLISTMPCRMQVVIAVGGGSTRW